MGSMAPSLFVCAIQTAALWDTRLEARPAKSIIKEIDLSQHRTFGMVLAHTLPVEIRGAVVYDATGQGHGRGTSGGT